MINILRKTAAVLLVAGICLLAPACGRNEAPPQNGENTTIEGFENPNPGKREDKPYNPEVRDSSEQLTEAKKINPDVVGWLWVPGTNLDEAVVQTSDNEYYYRRNYKKEYSFAGSIWMDYESEYGRDKSAMSQNVILYGHNLGSPQGVRDDKNGEKFAQLFKFTDEKFARENPYFYFTTEDGINTYEIFTVFYSEDITKPVPYHHISYSGEKFKSLIADLRSRSEYHYNVDVSARDKLMTLSTCTYKYGTYTQNPNQRFVVMGKLIDKTEDRYQNADIEKNPAPKEPVFTKG